MSNFVKDSIELNIFTIFLIFFILNVDKSNEVIFKHSSKINDISLTEEVLKLLKSKLVKCWQFSNIFVKFLALLVLNPFKLSKLIVYNIETYFPFL